MAKLEKTKPKVYLASSVYLDPVGCDSTISSKVITDDYGRLSGDVTLADCSRKISWYFSNEDSSVVKIDKAITALKEFRKTFVAARKVNPKKPEDE